MPGAVSRHLRLYEPAAFRNSHDQQPYRSEFGDAYMTFGGLLTSILVLGALIFVHEFGHFIVAKYCGVGVLRFSIGFGPALYRFRRRETEYVLSLIPLGGYVRMVGDLPDSITTSLPTDEDVRRTGAAQSGDEGTKASDFDEAMPPDVRACIENRSCWFIEKGLLARSSIVFAGPLFNFLFSIVIVAASVIIFGEPYLVKEPQIGSVMEGSPAEKGGIQKGDLVLSLNGNPVSTWEQLAQTIHGGDGSELTLIIARGEETLTVHVSPQLARIPSISGDVKSGYRIGIESTASHRAASAVQAAKVGVIWTVNRSLETCIGLWSMVRGYISPEELAGPLFIFGETSRQAEKGLEHLLYFMATLSVSLAVLNLLPIPVLDGGHLFFFFIEAVIGPISVRKRELAQQVGVVLLLCLMIFAIRNDIVRKAPDPKSMWEQPKEQVNP